MLGSTVIARTHANEPYKMEIREKVGNPNQGKEVVFYKNGLPKDNKDATITNNKDATIETETRTSTNHNPLPKHFNEKICHFKRGGI